MWESLLPQKRLLRFLGLTWATSGLGSSGRWNDAAEVQGCLPAPLSIRETALWPTSISEQLFFLLQLNKEKIVWKWDVSHWGRRAWASDSSVLWSRRWAPAPSGALGCSPRSPGTQVRSSHLTNAQSSSLTRGDSQWSWGIGFAGTWGILVSALSFSINCKMKKDGFRFLLSLLPVLLLITEMNVIQS